MAAAIIPFRIETPYSPLESTPVRLHWTGGTPPYNITVGTSTESVLARFPSLINTSVAWIANASAEVPLAVFGVDADGTNAISRRFRVRRGTRPDIMHHAASHKTSLSAGAIAGIAVAGAVALVAVLVLVLWIHKRRQRRDWRRRDTVDPGRSSPASPQPHLSTEALMSQHELPLGNAYASPVDPSGLSVVGDPSSAQAGEIIPGTVSEPVVLRSLPSIHRPETTSPMDPATRNDAFSVAEPTAQPVLQQGHNSHVGTRASTHARDGAVRLPRGPLDESDDDTATTVTLPPPYERY